MSLGQVIVTPQGFWGEKCLRGWGSAEEAGGSFRGCNSLVWAQGREIRWVSVLPCMGAMRRNIAFPSNVNGWWFFLAPSWNLVALCGWCLAVPHGRDVIRVRQKGQVEGYGGLCRVTGAARWLDRNMSCTQLQQAPVPSCSGYCKRCSWWLFFFDFLGNFFGVTLVPCEDSISTLSNGLSFSLALNFPKA